jgi:hypothetical protein
LFEFNREFFYRILENILIGSVEISMKWKATNWIHRKILKEFKKFHNCIKKESKFFKSPFSKVTLHSSRFSCKKFPKQFQRNFIFNSKLSIWMLEMLKSFLHILFENLLNKYNDASKSNISMNLINFIAITWSMFSGILFYNFDWRVSVKWRHFC